MDSRLEKVEDVDGAKASQASRAAKESKASSCTTLTSATSSTMAKETEVGKAVGSFGELFSFPPVGHDSSLVVSDPSKRCKTGGPASRNGTAESGSKIKPMTSHQVSSKTPRSSIKTIWKTPGGGTSRCASDGLAKKDGKAVPRRELLG